jgi:hypothetical protein
MASAVPRELRAGAHVQRFPLAGTLEVRAREVRMRGDGRAVVVLALWAAGQQQAKLTVPCSAWPGFMKALRKIQPTPARPPRPRSAEVDDDE